MAIILKDRVKVSSGTTGTGTITLGAAANGYQDFSAIGNGSITYYTIALQSGNEWEVGLGTVTQVTGIWYLARTTVYESSNANNLVNFSVGTKDVFVTYPAERGIYEEPDGQTLIDGGPITILGSGVTVNPTLEAELGKFVGNVNSFGQVYNLNQNDGDTASADFVAYNDLTTDGFTYFTDMGISSSNYTSVDYPLFTPNSGYVFHQGDDFFLGNQTTNKDVVLFAGGVEATNEAIRIKGTDQDVELANGLSVAGAATITGAAEFQSTVLLDANPTLALQAATKQYVDQQVTAGIHIHNPVRVETTGNLTATYAQGGTTFNITAITSGTTVTTSASHGLSVNDQIWLYTSAGNGLSTNTAYFVFSVPAANQLTLSLEFDGTQITGLTNATGLTYATRANSGIGATLTNAGTQVALTVDAVALSATNRVMVRLQTNGAENGVYVVTTVGSGATNWVLTRAADASFVSPSDPDGLGTGDYFFTQEGTLNAGDSHVLTTEPNTMIIGYTPLTYTQFSGSVDYTGGTNITVLGQTISVSGTIAATLGGTGTSTVTTGDLLYGSATNTWSKLPLGAAYKSLVVNASGTQVEWNAVPLNQSAAISGALGTTNGGTGITTYTLGDLIYSSATNTLAKLAGSVSTTKAFLTQTGTGAASAAPAWGTIAAADVSGLAPSATTDTTNAANITSGTLPTARLNGSYTGITGTGALAAGSLATGFTAVSAPIGGTGQSSYTVGDLLYANTTTSLAKLADVVSGNALISGGVGTAPAWGKIGAATHISGTLPVANGGTGVTSSTGTGSVVLSNSPTLVTPALGTPASGTVTNLTGTASININGTVGATTPAAGAFTTLAASGTTTLSGNQVISVTDNTNAALRITQIGTGNALLVEDSTNPDSTPFVIDNGGFVISGYTTSVVTAGSPVAPRVQVHGLGGGAATAGATSWSTGTDLGASFVLSRSEGGVVGTQTIVDSGDVLGNLRFAGSDGTAFIEAAKITAAVDGTPGINDMPGRLVFSTTADGASIPTERMRINNAGNVGIGIASSVDTTLYVGKNITGATTAYGILNNSPIQSDVTATAYMFRSRPQTAASAFTLTNLNHYQASQNTIGAGSTVTNQYGFAVESSLVGATNNYGFYGNIPAGTSNWNVYMVGTADNYFAGQVQLGAGTAAAPALSTTGDTNTGIFFPAADTIAFSEGGAEAMRIDSSGNVGIGTSSPGTRLTVASTGPNGIELSADPNALQDSGRLFFSSNIGNYALRNVSGSLLFLSGGTPGTSSGTERARIDSSGSVGIGTSSPSQKLDVVGSARIADTVYGYGAIELGQQGTGDRASYVDFHSSGTAGSLDFSARAIRNSGVNGNFDLSNTGTGNFNLVQNGSAPIVASINGTERLRVAATGAIAFNGASNYGTSGQVLTSSGNGPPTWAAAAGGGVTSITGTASQVTASASTGAVTLSLPATINVSTSGNAATATYLSSTRQTNLIVGQYATVADINNANDAGSFSCRGTTSVPASMSFHREGAFAINVGLSTANNFIIGGWSASSNAFSMTGAGALTMLNNVTAFSDERVKTNWRDLQSDFIERLAEVKHGVYDRTDQVSTQVGVGAQSLRPLMEHAVMENENGELSVAYGNAALVSAVQLAKRVVEQDARIAKLEALVAQLTKGNTP